MNDSIRKIRQLLDELEAQTANDQENAANAHSLPAAEMSVVIQEIVDDLHPLLTPYDRLLLAFISSFDCSRW